MERYLEFRIDEQTTELKMEAFLKKNAGLTKRQISQAKFRPDGIRRNGVRCRVTETIYPGDVIRVCLEEAGTASAHLENYNDGIKSKDLSDFHSNKASAPVSETSFSLNILYEDTDILAVDKPAGMVTHPTGMHYTNSLFFFFFFFFKEKNKPILLESIIQSASPFLLPVTFERKMNRSVSARWGGWIRRLPGLWFLPKIR